MKHEITLESAEGVACSCGYSGGSWRGDGGASYATFLANFHLRLNGAAFSVTSAMTGRSRTVRIAQHD